jgi:hypothetical protein
MQHKQDLLKEIQLCSASGEKIYQEKEINTLDNWDDRERSSAIQMLLK